MMGKRSNFKRRKHDAYQTPPSAVTPLLPHIEGHVWFAEPCVGEGRLRNELVAQGHVCTFQGDIETGQDALEFEAIDCEYIITNPPWSRSLLHPMIEHFRMQRPTWLLFDADWAHTKQAVPYLPYCHKIVSVGRVSWMENGTSGKDNCAWYLFDRDPAVTVFEGRAA